MTDNGVLLTPIEVRDNDGRRGPARLRGSLQELTDLLGRHKNREAPPGRDEPPEGRWAAARTKLGLGYAQRADGDRSENWELAIAAFEDALSAWTRERNPEQWATARMNLGVAYRERLAPRRRPLGQPGAGDRRV